VVKTYNITEIDRLARELWQEGRQCKTWIFDAPMGAGKTTLIHSICDFLGVTEAVSSPTFALINEYNSEGAGTIFHMDWYRLNSESEAIHAGMEDAMLSGHYCFIEWPEKAPGILPDNLFRIRIELVDETTRRLYTSTGPFTKKD
jgi:tRNA threonylcarbamoyladenosine biosynthesis protein TsaE